MLLNWEIIGVLEVVVVVLLLLLPVVVVRWVWLSWRRAALPGIEAAVESAKVELVAAGERVLVWKVSVLALTKLNAGSWDSLGFSVSQIPLLHRLAAVESQFVNDSKGAFIAIWKEACLKYTPLEVFGIMLELHKLKIARINKLKNIFSTYPFVGLLNVAALSVKMGMWDTLSDTFQLTGELGPNVDPSIRPFVTIWKEACQKYSAAEVLGKMLAFYGVGDKFRESSKIIFSQYPLKGFRDIAVASMKSGVWDSLCNELPSTGEPELVRNQVDYLIEEDSGPSSLSDEGTSKPASCVGVKNIVRKDLQYLDENLRFSDRGSHLDKIVSRQAMYYGAADSGIMTIMVDWVLPYAQCYIYNFYPEKYSQLKHSGFSKIYSLTITEVEKLFSLNVIETIGCASKTKSECTSLLEGSILYATQNSDSHSVFMELSRLFFDGTPDIHLANFLHMITVMAESGSTDEQIERFILNSQKMAKLPDEECPWCLSSSLPLQRMTDDFLVRSLSSAGIDEHIYWGSLEEPTFSSCTPERYETTSDLTYGHGKGVDTETELVDQIGNMGISGVCHVKEDEIVEPQSTVHPTSDETTYDNILQPPHMYMKPVADATKNSAPFLCLQAGQSKSRQKPGAQQARQTGKRGEFVAFKCFVKNAGAAAVNWVNQEKETGLPYDIVLGDGENREYIEVKTSRYARKDWIEISTREWQFATEKGEAYSIARVILSGGNLANFTVHKNPVKLCQVGELQLALMAPRRYKQ